MDAIAHIRQQALEQWRSGRVLRAWLGAEALFPYRIELDPAAVADLVPAATGLAAWVSPVASAGKCHLGRGYRIEFSADGERRRPRRVIFDQPIDLIQFLGREREFSDFVRQAREIRRRFPQLRPWIEAHPMRVLEVGERWPGLLARLEAPDEEGDAPPRDDTERRLLAELRPLIGTTGAGGSLP